MVLEGFPDMLMVSDVIYVWILGDFLDQVSGHSLTTLAEVFSALPLTKAASPS